MTIEGSRRRARPDRGLRRRRAITAVLIAVGLAVLAILDRSGLLLAPVGDARRFDGVTVEVVRIVDGDTLDVRRGAGGEPVRVRVWGIDTPEAGREGAPAEPYAEAATAFTAAFLAEGSAVLRLEPHSTRDRYGRLLAHVSTADGGDLAGALLGAGLARAVDRWPHSAVDAHVQRETSARRAGVGLWSDGG